MKYATLLTISLISFILLSFPLLSHNYAQAADDINENHLRDTIQTDVPTWGVGDQWVYDADIFSDSENGLFDISSNDLTMTVTDIDTVIIENRTEHIYVVSISGSVYGSFEATDLSGDIDGSIEGTIFFRQADLAVVQTNITSSGIIEWLIFDFDYEFASDATYLESFEYFDFPIKTNETWNSSSTVYQKSSFYVETFYDNESESTETMNGTATCIGVEDMLVPAGNFSCFHIITNGDETIESWYNADVKNVVKLNMNQSNETSTTIIYLNLSSYSLLNQSIDMTMNLSSQIAYVGSQILISGNALIYETGLPVSGIIDIYLAYTEKNYTVETNETGFYSIAINVPLILDNSKTSYDIGSDGIIGSIINDSNFGYKTVTLTVIGVAISDESASPAIQYETNNVTLSCYIYSVEPLNIT
ncbi:hypothetical protein DRJ16_06340, partial [Candidatus Woesearchaeota archaeon]